jgi:hypothetical protein
LIDDQHCVNPTTDSVPNPYKFSMQIVFLLESSVIGGDSISQQWDVFDTTPGTSPNFCDLHAASLWLVSAKSYNIVDPYPSGPQNFTSHGVQNCQYNGNIEQIGTFYCPGFTTPVPCSNYSINYRLACDMQPKFMCQWR